MDIYKEVLEEHKVTVEERKQLLSKANSVLVKLQDELNKNNIDAEVMLGGSAAKGTFVKGDFDCDVFIRFSSEYLDDQLSEILEKALEIFPQVERVHGSRDYFQASIDGIDYEFVPVKYIQHHTEAENVTDSSPLHVQWMKRNIADNPDLTDQIILTKLFCKASRIYGAESYLRGFSGHVIDILLVYYKTFENLLRASKDWQKATIIDVEGHNTSGEINESKVYSLIVIDPIQPLRNAAAALSYENMEYFKQVAEKFLASPSKDFFIKQPITLDYLNILKGENELHVLRATPLQGKDDIVGAKILKVFNYIQKQIQIHEFTLVDSGWEWDKKETALLYFITRPQELPEKRLREGPPVKVSKNAREFKEKHPDFWEENGRLYAYISREFTKAEQLISHLAGVEYVREKVKDIKVV